VWWDHEIPVGRAYDEVIEKALDGARCVVVLWSNQSVASRWVRAEAQAGLDHDRLVPALLEKDLRLPLAFRAIEGAALHDWRGESGHPELAKLLGRVAELAGDPSGDGTGEDAGAPIVREAPPSPAAPPARTQTLKLALPVAVTLAAVFGTTGWRLLTESKTRAPLPVASVVKQTPSPAPVAVDAAIAEPPKPIRAAVAAPPPVVIPAARRVPHAAREAAPAAPLSKSEVAAGLMRVKYKVDACYDQYKVPGTAMVNVVIAKNGKVSSASVTGKFAGTPTGRCVERVVKTAAFRPSDGLSTPYAFLLKERVPVKDDDGLGTPSF